jgi:aminoglycoside/choline kinase family phosphotransferase
MITKGGNPRIIDYQGARIGPPAYDVISLLWDPYYRLENDLRKSLLDYYMNVMSENSRWFSQKEFRKSIIPCRLQRHMQALGAYGFLSTVKGKKYFVKYIPEGLRLLKEDIAITKIEYTALFDLIKTL